MKFTRITHSPTVMGGKPCIRGLRVTVGTIIGLLASGESRERILEAYPYLEPADLDEITRGLAAEYASRAITVNCVAPGRIGGPRQVLVHLFGDERHKRRQQLGQRHEHDAVVVRRHLEMVALRGPGGGVRRVLDQGGMLPDSTASRFAFIRIWL